jgi:cysteine-S-conjugate beta-lyase
MTTKEFCEKYGVDRQGTNCLKWDALNVRFGDPDLISMWVADTEFKAPEQVREALKNRADHGVFGYSYTPDSYYNAFISWEKDHHGYEVKKDWIRFGSGVVNSIYWLVNVFTEIEDAIIILTPVYYPFHNAVKDNGRRLICSELVNTNGRYSIDFKKFEKDITDNDVKMFILCSPHNPAGRVWDEEELDSLLDICRRHNVLVLSDEIHQDLVITDKKHIPSAIVSGGKYANNLITLNAPSKTFNLAGLLNSHNIIENDELRAKYDAEIKKINQTESNIMGLVAGEAAYTYGEEWHQGLLKVIRENFEFVRESFAHELPKVIVTPLEGTYLAWLDLRAFMKPDEVKPFVQGKCRLAVDYGEWFSSNCKGFIRLNLATKPEYVHAAVKNLIDNLKKL